MNVPNIVESVKIVEKLDGAREVVDLVVHDTEVVDIVRGKTEAHLKEVFYIGKLMPELNVRRKYGN